MHRQQRVLELILQGHAPAALVMAEPEEILTLGVLIAETLFDRSLPVSLAPEDYRLLAFASHAHKGGRLSLGGGPAHHNVAPPYDGARRGRAGA